MNKTLKNLVMYFNKVSCSKLSNFKKLKLQLKIEAKIIQLMKKKSKLEWDYIKEDLIYYDNKTNIKSIKKKNKFFFLIEKIWHILHLKSYNFFFYNQKIDIIFFTQNRAILKNNLLYDLLCDEIIKILKKKYYVELFVSPHPKYGLKKNYYFERFNISLINFISKLRSILNLSVSPDYLFTNNTLIKHIYEINEFKKNQEKIWYSYFKKKKTKLIFFVDKITNQPIIKAANRLNIITVEIQHGSPSNKKFNYSNKPSIQEKFSPDYYFSFGKFWKKQLPNNYYNKNFVVVGQNLSIKIPKLHKKSKDWLVIDDLYSRDLLIDKSIFIKKKFNTNVIYRLHPAKLSLTDEEYFKLKKNKIKISNSTDFSISDNLKNTKSVICNFTTLIFECSNLGYDTYILNKNFYDKNFYKEILEKKKFLNMYKISTKKVKSLKMYENFNKKKISNFLNKII